MLNLDDQYKPERKKSGFLTRLRGNFLTGLVIVLPVALTIWMVWSFVGFVDNRVLPLVPSYYNPLTYVDFNIRGVGVVIFLVFTTLMGAITKGLFGRQLIRIGESIVDRVPVVRSIYNGVKQIVETITTSSDNNFDKVCMFEYPRKGIWAIGFISTKTGSEIREKAGSGELYSIFVPTTPNPTSGFLLFVPQKDTIVLDMDVEDAAKLIISAGIVEPPQKK
ncbi:DUF502 domain-containing protein [Amylibacter sp.]|jgi:uncharacterized membrane protein|nr:DUF502 domain-containing protein [Amylibacter sp.]MDA9304897.1 DUF502 domain-containing protein [Amylibacter sp.]MDC1376151.1 DUF502 domain-containing protein [Amylibacter sp.]|tara:strand:- start:85 stop:747 length:663 start_codon:yes stop_codon:yes gene_type:complete